MWLGALNPSPPKSGTPPASLPLGVFLTTGSLPRKGLLLPQKHLHPWPLVCDLTQSKRGEEPLWVGTETASQLVAEAPRS